MSDSPPIAHLDVSPVLVVAVVVVLSAVLASFWLGAATPFQRALAATLSLAVLVASGAWLRDLLAGRER